MDQQESVRQIPPDHQLPPAEPAPAHKKRGRYWLWLLAFLFICGILYWFLRGHGGKNAQPVGNLTQRPGLTGPVSITTATATTGDIGVYLSAIGTVTALYTDSINAQATGVIAAVYYKEGQPVRRGAPLIEIDPRPYQALVTEAQGTLERDQNLLAQAQMDLQRYKEAWSRNAIPRQTLEDQGKIVQQEEGTVKNDEGALRYEQVQLSYCHITAPISGRVGLRLVDPGNLVTANSTTALVVITQTQPITVVATISEDNLSEVMAQPSHGLNLPLEAWSRTNDKKLATGKVTSFDNQIDTTTGTVKLRALFENKNGELYPNEFVNTRLLVKTLRNQVLLPSSAIQYNGTAAFVYVIENSQATMRPIKTGVSNAGMTAVQGVKSGEAVADSGFQKLQNGSKVTIVQAPPPPNSSEENAP
jgi:membrane fusion protein, multidrug efflux system